LHCAFVASYTPDCDFADLVSKLAGGGYRMMFATAEKVIARRGDRVREDGEGLGDVDVLQLQVRL